ncbi:retrotransposon protein, putative, ty1-copia subclass [Tanacetum coccineum]
MHVDVFETPLPPAPAASADNQALADWNALFDRHNEVACLMLGTMSPKLYQQFENKSPQEMITELQKILKEKSVSDHALLMKSYLDQLATLNYAFPDKTISEVHSLLIEFEKSIKRNKQQIIGASSTPHVMAIHSGRVQKNKLQGKAKGKEKGKGLKNSYPTKPKNLNLTRKSVRQKMDNVTTAKRKDIGKGTSLHMKSLKQLSQEFKDYLKANGIVQQLTPPYTPQHNGVSERRNRTLLNMNPGEAHWTAVKNILKYLRNTKDTFLVYGGNPEAELQVKCYCDAGFETDRDETKSQTGYVFVLNGGAVVWKSSKQSTTAQHATEVEYIVASEAAKEAVWIRKFIDELGVVPSNDYPIKMNCDNSAAIIIAKEIRIQKGANTCHRISLCFREVH